MPKTKNRSVPEDGTLCVKTYKKVKYTMRVIRTETGIAYKLGGKIYSSPSSAAKSITKSEVNGWVFWSLN